VTSLLRAEVHLLSLLINSPMIVASRQRLCVGRIAKTARHVKQV